MFVDIFSITMKNIYMQAKQFELYYKGIPVNNIACYYSAIM